MDASGRKYGPGFVVTMLGVLLLGGAIAWSLTSGPEAPAGCALKPTALVRFPDCQLDVNEPFVVEIRRDQLFAAERERLVATAERRDAASQRARETGAESDARTVQTVSAEYEALPKQATVVLFVDGVATPARDAVDIEGTLADPGAWTRLEFRLEPAANAGTDDGRAWRKLLAGNSGFGSRAVALGLGDPGAAAPRTGTLVEGARLAVFRPAVVLVAGIGLLAIVVGLAMQFWKTGMLRDGTPAGDVLPPFSLARVQAAWWMVLTIGGFIFVFLATRQYAGVVTGSTLGLIGISGATFLAARGIDQTAAPAPAPRASRGFFRDLMTDGETVALQRIQMVAWTVILGLIFAGLTLRDLSFPEFDSNLLILSGLVSATYAGFKVPENDRARKAAETRAAQPGP
jgi:hypothetical protein